MQGHLLNINKLYTDWGPGIDRRISGAFSQQPPDGACVLCLFRSMLECTSKIVVKADMDWAYGN